MERNELRDLERRCIQEELPYCQVACPLKVDVRAFCAAMAERRFDEAKKVLSKAMSFPEILGRICDHPCEDACVLSKKGGAISLGKLERECLMRSGESKPPLRFPSTGKLVSIYGGGLSSITCAFELAKKGYGVKMVFEGDIPGGRLLSLPEEVLPEEILVKVWDVLEKTGAIRSSGVDPLKKGLQEGEVAYIGVDDPLWSDSLAVEDVDPVTYETSAKGVFAGGFVRNGKHSPVWEAADGKRAANSIDRFLQGASLTSGREREISLETKLFTPLDDVPSLPPSNDPVEEARRCIGCECRYCVRECVFLGKYKGYPKTYAREIYNNFAIVQGSRTANKMINSCALCGLCEILCPNDFPMAELCRSARGQMVDKDIMPPSVHEFALLDMDHANSPWAAGWRPGKRATRAVFFPGCQLGAAMPDQTQKLIEHLYGLFEGDMGLLLGCCGAPAWWSGRKKSVEEVVGNIGKTLESEGNPILILACSSCDEVFSKFLPHVPRVSVWQILLEKGLPDGKTQKSPLALHDPCTTRLNGDWQASVRQILQTLGQEFEELDFGRERTRCCGYGGLQVMADPDLAKEGVRRRLSESENDFLAYCAMCRESLAGSGKRVLHLLDLLFPLPFEAGRTGFSKRQWNRKRLREKLLGPCGLSREPWEGLVITVPEDVREKLEERHILDSDIMYTLWQAQESGMFLISPEDTRLASSRRGNVTFWVEYRPEEDSFFIINAWSHRMTVELMS